MIMLREIDRKTFHFAIYCQVVGASVQSRVCLWGYNIMHAKKKGMVGMYVLTNIKISIHLLLSLMFSRSS